MDTLRPKQREIITYNSGKMGVSAVPGSGKTFTLSRLAAKLVLEGGLNDDQEVLIVTLTNSAVENFYHQLSGQLKEYHWFPNFGYRIRTLHGLATDIVRENSARLGLSERFEIMDDRESTAIRNEVARAWLSSHRDFFEPFLKTDLEDHERSRIIEKDYPVLVQDIALAFIRSAKNLRLVPENLRLKLESIPDLPLAKMGCDLFTSYQRSLEYRGAVDFDDLIVLALKALEGDSDLLDRLRYRWPFILEDEAQDSSLLQEQILRLLSGDGYLPSQEVNWVRVGDPNQAIYETFTTANPRFLREFLQRPDVVAKDLPNSGRFSDSIICLANYLAAWTFYEHPVEVVRTALQPDPCILPIPPGDPQPLQIDDPRKITPYVKALDAEKEVDLIARSLKKWLDENPNDTAAALAPTNFRAEQLVDELKKRGIPYNDSLLRASSTARITVKGFQAVLAYLCDPKSGHKLADLFLVWQRSKGYGPEDHQVVDQGMEWLRRINKVETFLWPDPGDDILEKANLTEKEPAVHGQLVRFRELVRRWMGAMQYPIDQVILTVAHDLLKSPIEWAIAQKLANHLRRAGRLNPSLRLPDMLNELSELDRRGAYIGFSTDENGFDPKKHRGEVVVATMHKAKGLEWDRVYLLSVNTYDFPAAIEGDRFRSEQWFFHPGVNLVAEALEQLDTVVSNDPYAWYEEGRASQAARIDLARERLRLLYVGITRAKRELVITSNNGKWHDMKPALALTALASFWEQRLAKQLSAEQRLEE